MQKSERIAFRYVKIKNMYVNVLQFKVLIFIKEDLEVELGRYHR